MTSDPYSPNFRYKKYSLEQLDNWVNDALNCEDLSPQDIYDTIVNVVDESVEYHKKYLTKSIELLSLLKGNRLVHDFLEEYQTTPFSEASEKDWRDFWHEYPSDSQYTLEEMDAMCDAAEEKEKCREYNLREAEYYNKRAQLDLEEVNKQLAIAREHDDKEMAEKGFVRDENGSWTKQTDKGVATVSAKPDPYVELIRQAGGYEWTPEV